mgnify:CR=1 FL=1
MCISVKKWKLSFSITNGCSGINGKKITGERKVRTKSFPAKIKGVLPTANLFYEVHVLFNLVELFVYDI